jgi:hypothetical protein
LDESLLSGVEHFDPIVSTWNYADLSYEKAYGFRRRRCGLPGSIQRGTSTEAATQATISCIA